jgi:hypothetical protein
MIDSTPSPLIAAVLAFCEGRITRCIDEDEAIMEALRRDFEASIYASSPVLPPEAVVDLIQIPQG